MILRVKVKRNSRSSSLEQASDGTWVARLKSPPVDGKANQELIALVADHFHCSKAAVLITAVGHAAYKTALFGLPPAYVAAGFSLRSIAFWTTLGGIGLGVLRTKSESVLPAVVAHMVFDATVYSGFPEPPWWVWR